ncbi:MAG: hypothetical protein R6W90_14325, partial [Ignavibacteriaceae bacterium]
MDPQSESFVNYSPYLYAVDNPLIFVDKNGEGPLLAIIGVVGGAAYEFASQVGANLANGQSISEAVGNVDYADVGITAGEYGLAGLTNGASLFVSGFVSDALQAGVDINGSGEVYTVVGGFNGGETKELSKAGIELGASTATSFIPGGEKILKNFGSDKAVKQATSNVSAATKNLAKANNKFKTGDIRTKAQTPNMASKNLSSAESKLDVAKKLYKVNNNKYALFG